MFYYFCFSQAQWAWEYLRLYPRHSASLQTLMFSLQLGYRIAPHKSCYLLQLICATNSLSVWNFLLVNDTVIKFRIYLVQFIIKISTHLFYLSLYVALGFFHPCPAFEAAKLLVLCSHKGGNFSTCWFLWVARWRPLFAALKRCVFSRLKTWVCWEKMFLESAAWEPCLLVYFLLSPLPQLIIV